MDDNLDLEASDTYMSKGHDHYGDLNQRDFLAYQMANQQVPGYQDEDDEDDDDRDDFHDDLAYRQNQSSFTPSQTGKDFVDSSLSDSNVDLGREDGMLFDYMEGQQHDLGTQGKAFQPDLLNMNPFSLESNNGYSNANFGDNLFQPNDLSKMTSAQMGYQAYGPTSQTPDLLMMESSPVHTGLKENVDQTDNSKQSCDTYFKSCEDSDIQTENLQHKQHEAIENDFYNADKSDEIYKDEYLDSGESDYSNYSDEEMEKDTDLEQIVPHISEGQQTETKTETDNNFFNEMDPNIGASGISAKESDFSKNVQFDDHIGQNQYSDEENGNIGFKTGEENMLGDTETQQVVDKNLSEHPTNPRTYSMLEEDKYLEDMTSEKKPSEAEGIPKSSTFTIESDDSDLEERSLTPDSHQLERMESGHSVQNFPEEQCQINILSGGTLMEGEESDNKDLEIHEEEDKIHTGSLCAGIEKQSGLVYEEDVQHSQTFEEQFSENVHMTSDQNNILDRGDSSPFEADERCLGDQQKNQDFDENFSDTELEENFAQQNRFVDQQTEEIMDADNDDESLEENEDEIAKSEQVLQNQSQEGALFGDKQQEQSSFSQTSASDIDDHVKYCEPVGIQKQILEKNIEDVKKEAFDEKSPSQNVEQCLSDDIHQTEKDLESHDQMSPSDSEDEIYDAQLQTNESKLKGSIEFEHGKAFAEQKYKEEVDESISSEGEEDFTKSEPIEVSQIEENYTNEIKPDGDRHISHELEEGYPDNTKVKETEIEGSLKMEEGQTFEDEQVGENEEPQLEQSTAEVSPDDEIAAVSMRESGMQSSFVIDKGETFDDKKFEGNEFDQSSPEDEITDHKTRESGMEGSFVLDEGETFDNKGFKSDEPEFEQSSPENSPEDEIPINKTRESGMEGSFVFEEGETFEDKQDEEDQNEFVQSTPEVSPADEIPANQLRESGMEGSFVLDEGETFEDGQHVEDHEEFVQSSPELSHEEETPAHQMRESGMEGSLVLDQGETFDDKNDDSNEPEFVQSSPEVSPESEMPVNQRESGMEGSLVLDEGETFDDKNDDSNEPEFEQSTPEVSPESEMPANQRESGMEGSLVLDEGETFDYKNDDSNEPDFEQSTPEVSPESEMPANQRESGMEGSLGLDEGEIFEDQKMEDEDEFIQSEISSNQMREPLKNSSILVDEGETLKVGDTNISVLEDTSISIDQVPEEELIKEPDRDEEQVLNEDIDLEPLNAERSLILESQPVEVLPVENLISDDILLSSQIPAEEMENVDDVVEEKFEQEAKESAEAETLETPVDSYGEEADVDSAIQSPVSQDGIVQSPSSDGNEAIYVEQENEKNLMSSSLIGESFGLNQGETIETYQPCVQNGLSHSASEDVTPEKEEGEQHYYQNGISQSASEEFTPDKEERQADFDLIQNNDNKSVSSKTGSIIEVEDSIKKDIQKDKESKKEDEVKKPGKESPKKTTKFSKTETKKKDVTKETKKILKDTTQNKEIQIKSPTKPDKRSVSASRVTTTPQVPTKSTARLPRDTTRKPRPTATSTEPSKPSEIKQRPKSIDISRTSSLTRPTASSLSKSRTFEKSATEGALSPTKPMKTLQKTVPSRYRIIKSKKDGSSDSGVEEDKSPKKTEKTETIKKSQDDKMTRSTSANKKSTIPTMNKSPTKSEGSPKKTAGKTTPTKPAQSKIGSLDNSKHTPGGGQVKIPSQRADFSNVNSKVGSKDFIDHKPAGGEKKILSQKLEWKAESKVGSLKNATYSPGGGKVKIESKKLDFKDKAQSKVGSKDYISHKPGGGDKKIESQKLNFKEKAQPKVGSKDNIDHKPLGGDKKIDTQKLNFKESAKPRTDTGVASGKSRPDSGIECEKTEASV